MGTGTDWHDPVNWGADELPGVDDDVEIGPEFAAITISSGSNVSVNKLTSEAAIRMTGGTFALANDSMLTELTFSGGTLTGTGDVTVTDTLTWSSGTMTGAGKTVLAPGASGTISGTGYPGADKYLGRTLENAGTIDYTGQSLHFGTYAGAAGVIDNLATGRFNVTGEGDFDVYIAPGPHAFNNAGTFTKSSDGTTSFSGVAFSSTGSLQVQAGTLDLTGSIAVDGNSYFASQPSTTALG